MDDPEFQRGEIDIQWLERRLPTLLDRAPNPDSVRIAATAAALLAERARTARSVSTGGAASAKSGRATPETADLWKQAARTDGLRD
jgi:hypothetical protein